MWQTINASEVMRITTSNNLLIGSSVDGGQRLQVAGKVNSTGYFLNGMTAGSGALYWASDRVTLANYNVGGILSFEVNGGASAATIDASGNFGLGVTPSAWRSGDKVIDIGATSSIVNAQGLETRIYQNAYVSSAGVNTYKTTAAAAYFGTSSGAFAWFNAPSGTAGNAITFTQAMTLNANGNLLVGTSIDAGQKLQILGISKLEGNTIIGSSNTADIFTRGYSGTILGINSSFQSAIELNSGTGNAAYFDMGVNGNRTLGIFSDITSSDISTIGTRPLNLSTNSIPRLVIKASGIINLTNVPTSSAGLVSGDIYQTAGVLNIVP
jgi:hypothetical protein